MGQTGNPEQHLLELDLDDPTERMPRTLLDAALQALVDETFELVTKPGDTCHF